MLKVQLSKSQIIKELSEDSDNTGNLLVEMLDKYQVSGLRELTTAQAQEFYRLWKLKF